MTIHKSVSELIGKTPLVELTNYEKNHNLEATLVGKVELFNPAGSVKDRRAKAMRRHRHHRADVGQHGHRSVRHCGGAWQPRHHYHAGNHVR